MRCKKVTVSYDYFIPIGDRDYAAKVQDILQGAFDKIDDMWDQWRENQDREEFKKLVGHIDAAAALRQEISDLKEEVRQLQVKQGIRKE